MGNTVGGTPAWCKQEDYLRPDHEIFSGSDCSYNYTFECFKWSRSGVVENKKRRVFKLRGGMLRYFDDSLKRKNDPSLNAKKSKRVSMARESEILGTMNLAEAEAVAEEGKIYIKAGIANEKDLQLEVDPASLHKHTEVVILKQIHLHITMATIKHRVENLIRAHEVMQECDSKHEPTPESEALFEAALQAAREVDDRAMLHPSLVTVSKKNGGGLYVPLEHMWHIRAVIGLFILKARDVSPLDGSFLHVRDDYLRALESSARRPLNEFYFLYKNMEGLVHVYMLRAEAAGEAGDKRLQCTLLDDVLKIYSVGLQESLRREGVTMYASILAENIGRMHWDIKKSRNKAFESLHESRCYARQAAKAGKLSHPMVNMSYSTVRERLEEIDMVKKEIESS